MADRVALITGGSRGIGAAVALRSARDGTAIAIGYRSRAAQAEAVAATCRAAGTDAVAFRVDLAEPRGVEVAVRARPEALRPARRLGQRRGRERHADAGLPRDGG